MDIQNPVAYWTVPYAYDNCSGVNLSSNFSPGTIFPLGTTTVIYTATDLCGNSSSCSFNVTVTSPPQPLECPDDIYLTCNSSNGVFVDWDPPSYDGYCGNCTGGQYIPGFVYMGALNGHEYYCSTSPASWAMAQQICASKGGYLASIGSKEENDFLSDILTLQSAWIGLTDNAWEGEYMWDSGEPFSYSNWYPGQPNDYNGQQDCVEMLNSGYWNDQYNHYNLEFIMELPCGNVEQIAGPSPGSYLQAGSYTVSYKVNDQCSYNNICSFEINITGGLNITCPQDIVVTPPAGSNNVQVNWNEPSYSSCCGQCSNGNNYIPGFVYMGSFNGHHYYGSNQTATWPSAQAHCTSLGGQLAVINSAAENTFLSSHLTTQTAWIGLSDFASEGHFTWVNGDPLSYTNWYPGQPNNYGSGQDYVELMNTGYWNDQYNYSSHPYILELSDCVQVNQISGPQPGAVLPANSQYTVVYEVEDGCGNTEVCSFNITVEGSNNFNYCLANGADAYEYHITRVQFANLDNISANDGGYEDYTNFCAEVEANNAYMLTLTPGDLSNSGELKYWRVWIDYNEDGDFFDSGEMVAYGSGAGQIAGMVTIPSNITSGETRMRVIMSLDRYPQTPCDQFPIGEVEDYCVLTKNTFNTPGDVHKRQDVEAVALESISRNAKLYPNPAFKILNIEIDQINPAKAMSVLDIQGRVIQKLTQESNNGLIKLDVSQLAEGLYFLDIIYKDGRQERQKFIVQN
ncbi:MAG: HYR domain-containing protein [Gammaproteobacteria bacterium]|nr:HYR domain-containing protein [Gammaproteobacteria bacterium]